MSLRDILVVLDGSARDDAKLIMAFALARRNGAHVTGLCATELLVPPEMALAFSGYPDMWPVPELTRKIDEAVRQRAQAVENKFRERLRQEDANGDWELDDNTVLPAILGRAHVADLVVMGQRNPDHPVPPIARTLIEDVLMSAGRPVLIIPYAGTFEDIGRNVLIGWSHTRESARALHDSLALIEDGAQVTVLTAETNPSGPETLPTADVGEHLARHRLKVSATRTLLTDGLAPADALLGYAADHGCDLLVTGAYGHSRTREMILGGVTRDLLRHMTVPVLMAH